MKTVFFDVDTQIDFLYPAGALYVPGAESIVPLVAKLNHYAAEHSMPVISDMDAHVENDAEFRAWPHHCVVGTVGQQKPQNTLLEKRVVVPFRKAEFKVAGVQQIILEKQVLDCFRNPNLPRLLEELDADRYVVYGVVTEICVRFAALGLVKTGKRVELVTDAVRSLNRQQADETMAEFTAAGGVLTTAAEVCG